MITTDINYPEGLPAPQWASNSSTIVSPTLRSSMESGRARQRRRYSSVPVMRQATWIFTSAQAQLFEIWFANTLKDGTNWFNMPLRHPMGYRAYVCRVVESYDGPKASGADRWQYSATLELWERPLLPKGWENFPEIILGSAIFDAAMNREWPPA